MKKMNFEGILAELKALPNWVGFKVWRDARSGKWQKRPVDIMASEAARAKDKNAKAVLASSTKRETWTDFESARRAVEGHKFGISCLGFAFDGGGIVGIDLDHCVAEDGGLSDFAKEVLESVPSYAEYSPSGTGVHILARCTKPFGGSGINKPEIEIYRSGRFFTVTGNKLSESSCEVLDCTDAVVSLYERYGGACEGVVRAVSRSLGEVGFVSDPQNNAVVGQPLATVGEADILNEVSGRSKTVADLSDDELLDKARNAKGGVKFEALWRGDFSGYKSQSEADLALCNSLAFWTADDAARMDRLFCASGLYRQKWQEKHGSTTYGQKTIEQVLSRPHDVYKLPAPRTEDKPKRKRASLGEAAIAEIENAYHLVQTDGKSKRLTNFVIKPNRKLTTDDETVYSVTLIGADGRRAEKRLNTADLVSSQSFKKKLSERDIGWSFLASDRELELIKEYINGLPCPNVVGFKGIGILHLPTEDKPLRYVYAGERATIDGDGRRVDGAESVPCENPIRSTIEDTDEISNYELIQAVHALLGYNELPKTASVLCYMAAAIAKPKLTERGIKFPHLVIVGECGSGKSFTVEKVIQAFFGLKSIVGASKITNYTFLTAAGASNCIPLIIDEYKPSTMRDNIVETIHNGLRDLYDGHEGQRGKADMSVRSYRLTAPLVLCGEESPSESALKERSIELLFSKTDILGRLDGGALIESPSMQEYIRNLGKAVLLTVLRTPSIELRYEYNNLRNLTDERLAPRVRNNVAAIGVGVYLLELTAKRYGADFKTAFGIERSEILPAITEAVKRYTLGGGEYNKSVVDRAFEVFDRMTEVLKADVHYKRVDGMDAPAIAFDIKRIYDRFTKYHRECNHKDEILEFNMFRCQLEKKDYFLRRNYAVRLKDDGEYNGGASHIVKCYLLDAKRLSACADISNILERLTISLTPETRVQTLIPMDEEFPF